MWDLPGPGLEPVSPALAGRFLTTVPPGKPSIVVKDRFWLKFRLCHLLAQIQSFCLFFFKQGHRFIYLFLAALGLRCCVQAFSSCGERGLLFVAVHGILLVVASLVVERGR